MWELYDRLIAAIPSDLSADLVLEGCSWTMVRSADSCGLAAAAGAGTGAARTLPAHCDGMPLRELAEAVKSSNYAEASLGLAAINAWWNSPERELVQQALKRSDGNPFAVWLNEAAGKKVAIAGRFKDDEAAFRDICELSILDNPEKDMAAWEARVAAQDLVFATGLAFVNKTISRLLEICAPRSGAPRLEVPRLVLAGPCAPLAPLLLDRGVRDIQGFVITGADICQSVVSGNTSYLGIFDAGKRVSVSRST
jgi:uncharacterized protein (DUF4213/DUF364 family)